MNQIHIEMVILATLQINFNLHNDFLVNSVTIKLKVFLQQCCLLLVLSLVYHKSLPINFFYCIGYFVSTTLDIIIIQCTQMSTYETYQAQADIQIPFSFILQVLHIRYLFFREGPCSSWQFSKKYFCVPLVKIC